MDVGVAVGVAVGVTVGVGVGVLLGVGVELCVGVGVEDGLEDGVAVTVAVIVTMTLAVTVTLTVTIDVAVTVCVTVPRGGLGEMQTTMIRCWLWGRDFTGFAEHDAPLGLSVVAWTAPIVIPTTSRTAVRAEMAARLGVMGPSPVSHTHPRPKVAARLSIWWLRATAMSKTVDQHPQDQTTPDHLREAGLDLERTPICSVEV